MRVAFALYKLFATLFIYGINVKVKGRIGLPLIYDLLDLEDEGSIEEFPLSYF